MQWSVVTLWQEEPEDAGVEFEQRFRLATSVQTLVENTARWKFEKPNHRIIATTLGFPANAGRKLDLHLAYRVVGASEWVPVTSFSIEVIQELT